MRRRAKAEREIKAGVGAAGQPVGNEAAWGRRRFINHCVFRIYVL